MNGSAGLMSGLVWDFLTTMISRNGSARRGLNWRMARDLFVHHFGSRTFAGNCVDMGRLLDENAHRFAEKWRLTRASGRRVAIRPFVDSEFQKPDYTLQNPSCTLVPTVRRGNAAPAAPRPGVRVGSSQMHGSGATQARADQEAGQARGFEITLRASDRFDSAEEVDAERRGRHSHGDRGNEIEKQAVRNGNSTTLLASATERARSA